MITAEGWGWRHAGREEWAVRGLDLVVPDGQKVLLLGASGAGKSTLLHALAGVLGGDVEGTEAGRLTIDGAHPTRRQGRAGLVMQDPDAQVVLAKVGDDVAFGCENLGIGPEETWRRVAEALRDVDLGVSLDRSTAALSGGQKQRLVIAGALAMRAPLLLLDEPTANLDPAGIAEVRDVVARVVREHASTLVVVEHRTEVWADLVDRVVVLRPGGGVMADGRPDDVFRRHRRELLDAGVWVPGCPPPDDLALPGTPRATTSARSTDPTRPAPRTARPDALAGRDLTIGHTAGHPVREHLDVHVPSATSTMVTGPNGAGKSTLALTLAGLLPRLDGEVVAAPGLRPGTPRHRGLIRRRELDVADPSNWRSRELLTRIGTVFQQPEHQFTSPTVREELAVGLRSLAKVEPSWTPARITARVDELLDRLHLASVADANPFTLSGGEKRRLSVGTVLATGPQVIFLDEPTFGQDRNTWLDMVALVREMVAEGRTVVSVTHDPDFIALLGQHHVDLAGTHG